MHQKWLQTTEVEVGSTNKKGTFYVETIEVGQLSALAFFAAGEQKYKGKRFFWQNREKTFTLVGLGTAYVFQNNDEHNRFTEVEKQWNELTKNIVKEEKEPQPILFGGFTFDPKKKEEDEWSKFPDSYFTVATFQLVIQQDKAYVSIHLITDCEQNSAHAFEQLRKERDQLIHAAQVKELKTYKKPTIKNDEERFKEDYLQSIEQVTNLIKQGDAEKVVVSRSLQLEFEQEVSSPQVLAQIMNEQHESYLFGMEKESLFFFGASPERLVKVNEGDALSACVAGSIKRGATSEEDQVLGDFLLNDCKNLEEHQYVVDMIKDVFEKNCTSYQVPSRPKLLKIRDIQHLFTPVEGKLSSNSSILKLVEHLHPTPALGGVPKNDALAIIRMVEPLSRGLYAAPIGWVDATGNGEFAVAIRSAAVVDEKAYLYAGGGIVEDSTPTSEYEETLVKFRPMLRALGGKVNE